MLTGSQQSCAVVGSPIGHSLSPAMHRAAYAALGLTDWRYDAHDVVAGSLAPFVERHDELHALSVTMPLKREAAALAATRSDDVAYLGVANTLVRGADGWTATNTDIPGAVAALREQGVTSIATARILGGGATAASMAVAAVRLGAEEIRFVVRDVARGAVVARLVAELGVATSVELLGAAVVEGTDLLVSTLPVAALAGRDHELGGSAETVFDVVYDPFPTALTAAARRAGRTVVAGLDLLAHQAVLQVLAMTGQPVEVDLLRRAAVAALDERG